MVTDSINRTPQRELASRLIELAEAALTGGDVAEAERLYRDVLDFLALILPSVHIERAKALYKLACILEYQEKNAEALELMRQARSIMRALESGVRTVDAVFAPFVWQRSS